MISDFFSRQVDVRKIAVGGYLLLLKKFTVSHSTHTVETLHHLYELCWQGVLARCVCVYIAGYECIYYCHTMCYTV